MYTAHVYKAGIDVLVLFGASHEPRSMCIICSGMNIYTHCITCSHLTWEFVMVTVLALHFEASNDVSVLLRWLPADLLQKLPQVQTYCS